MEQEKRKPKEQIISEAILEDKVIKECNDKKMEIYSKSKYVVRIIEGELVQIWPDEVNNLVSELNKLIELRIAQINSHYSGM